MIMQAWRERRARHEMHVAAVVRSRERAARHARWSSDYVLSEGWEKHAYWFYGTDMDDPEVTVR